MADLTVGGKTQMEVTHHDQVKIELARGQRGTYGWTVTVYGKTATEAIKYATDADVDLYRRFGGGNGNDSTE